MDKALQSRCRLCGESAPIAFIRPVYDVSAVAYYHCDSCGFTETEEPSWLERAYETPIHASDTGMVRRNLAMQGVLAVFMWLMRIDESLGLDYAGGYGLLTRLMRDIGYDFRHLDPFAPNLFAAQAEWSETCGAPTVVSALEYLEHLVEPVEEFGNVTALNPRYIVTSTVVNPYAGPPDPEWWYLAPQSGQHVGFFMPPTLVELGRRTGYPYVSVGPEYQLFSQTPLPKLRWAAAQALGPRFFRAGASILSLLGAGVAPYTESDSLLGEVDE